MTEYNKNYSNWVLYQGKSLDYLLDQKKFMIDAIRWHMAEKLDDVYRFKDDNSPWLYDDDKFYELIDKYLTSIKYINYMIDEGKYSEVNNYETL